jgi:hypothetical protein
MAHPALSDVAGPRYALALGAAACLAAVVIGSWTGKVADGSDLSLGELAKFTGSKGQWEWGAISDRYAATQSRLESSISWIYHSSSKNQPHRPTESSSFASRESSSIHRDRRIMSPASPFPSRLQPSIYAGQMLTRTAADSLNTHGLQPKLPDSACPGNCRRDHPHRAGDGPCPVRAGSPTESVNLGEAWGCQAITSAYAEWYGYDPDAAAGT